MVAISVNKPETLNSAQVYCRRPRIALLYIYVFLSSVYILNSEFRQLQAIRPITVGADFIQLRTHIAFKQSRNIGKHAPPEFLCAFQLEFRGKSKQGQGREKAG